MTITSTTELTLLRALSEALMCLLNKEAEDGKEINKSLRILGEATSCVSFALISFEHQEIGRMPVCFFRERMGYDRTKGVWQQNDSSVIVFPEDDISVATTLNTILKEKSLRGRKEDLPEVLQQEFHAPGSDYYLMYQIFLAEASWGALVFNHHRPWTQKEEQAIRPFTSALSSYLKREQYQLELQEQRDYFRLILDSLPTAVVSKNREGRFLMANKVFARLFDASQEELLKISEEEFFDDPELLKMIRAENQHIFDTGNPLFIPRRVINEQAGDYNYASINKIPISLNGGGVKELLIVMSDISKEVKQEGAIDEGKRLNRGIAETMPDYLFLIKVSPEGKRTVSYHNVRSLLFGYDLSDWQRSFDIFYEAIHPEDRKEAIDDFRARLIDMTDEDVISVSYRVRSVDGSWHWLSERAKVFKRYPDGRVMEYLSILQDITSEQQTRLELGDREALFRGIYENSPNGIVLIDKNVRFLRANPAFCELLGYTEAELQKLATWNVTYREDLEQEVELIRRVINGRRSFEKIEKRYKRKDGSPVWASVSLNFLYSEDDQFEMALGIIEDITEKKAVQEKLASTQKLQQAILNALPDIIARLTPEGVVIQYYINAGMDQNEIPFFRPLKVTGKNLNSFLPYGIALGATKNIEKTIATGKVRVFDFKLKVADRDMFLEARFNKINDEEVLVVLRNISVKKNYELALNENLRELQQKKVELEQYIESNLQLENFAYLASHDLRQPVRMIRSFGQIIAMRYREQLDIDGKNYLDQITDNADYLNSMILDLLEYSRINAEEIEAEPCEIPPLIDAVIQNLEESIEKADANIYIGELPEVIMASYARLRQVFQNLIGNAIRFRSKDRPLEIFISASETLTSWQFNIEDNGIGIHQDMHEQVFVILKRLHARTEYKGTGLGLALCKTIIEQHNGRIWVESEEGKGSVFSFTISKELHCC